MDGSTMFPNGFHPVRKRLNTDGFSRAKYISRTRAGSVKYYYIDLGMSKLIRREADRRMVIKQGAAKLPPEIERGDVYDPFPVDLYYLGHVYREHLLEVRDLPLRNVLVRANFLWSHICKHGIPSPFDRGLDSTRSQSSPVSTSGPISVRKLGLFSQRIYTEMETAKAQRGPVVKKLQGCTAYRSRGALYYLCYGHVTNQICSICHCIFTTWVESSMR